MPDKVATLVTPLLNESNERNFDGIRSIEDAGEKLSADLVRADLIARSPHVGARNSAPTRSTAQNSETAL